MSFTDQTSDDSSMAHCVVRVHKAENHPQIRHAKSKLLVLDGDSETLHAIVEVAKPYFQVIQTSDPQWAMAWLGQYRDVTVFLVEEDLPQGSGSQLLMRSQAMRPEVLRVLMSRTVDNPNVVQSLKRGIAQTLLEKPMSREALLAAIVPQSVDQSDLPHLIVA
jgi:DNA-binding NtrC family response regulator